MNRGDLSKEYKISIPKFDCSDFGCYSLFPILLLLAGIISYNPILLFWGSFLIITIVYFLIQERIDAGKNIIEEYKSCCNKYNQKNTYRKTPQEYMRCLLGWFLPNDWRNQKGAKYIYEFTDIVNVKFDKQNGSLICSALGLKTFYGKSYRIEVLKALMAYSLANGTYQKSVKDLKRLAHHLDFDKESYEDVLESVYEILSTKGNDKYKIPYYLGECDSLLFSNYLKKYNKYKDCFGGKARYCCDKEPKMMEVALRMFAAMVFADRQEMVCEIDVVREFVRKNDKNNFSKRMGEFSQYMNYDYVIEDLALAAIWFHKKSVMAIFQTMVTMAYADFDFCEAEMILLRKVALAMHINHDEFEEAIKAEAAWAESEKKRQEEASKGYWTTDRNGKREFHYFSDFDKTTSDSEENDSDSEKTGESSQQEVYIPYELRKAYEALGISPTSTLSEIKARKRNLMRVNHPDVVANRGEEAVKAATIKCQEINKAFEIVKKYRKC